MIYLRFGTILNIFQKYYNESIRTFSKRLNMSTPTLNTYIRGVRFPGKQINQDMPYIVNTLQSFIEKSLSEIFLDKNFDVKAYVLDILRLEKNLRGITEIPMDSVRLAGTKVLLEYLKNFSEDYPDIHADDLHIKPFDCLSIIFDNNNIKYIDKQTIALFLMGKNLENLYYEIRSQSDQYIWPNSTISEIVEFCENNTTLISYEVSLDVLMGLTEQFSLNLDCKNNHELVINVRDQFLSSEPIKIKGKRLVSF